MIPEPPPSPLRSPYEIESATLCFRHIDVLLKAFAMMHVICEAAEADRDIDIPFIEGATERGRLRGHSVIAGSGFLNADEGVRQGEESISARQALLEVIVALSEDLLPRAKASLARDKAADAKGNDPLTQS